MRCLTVLAALTALTLSERAGAIQQNIWPPIPKPLGVLVRDSGTIHVLQITSVGSKGVTFKTAATLKGKDGQILFQFPYHFDSAESGDLFRVGATVICFRKGEEATLFVGGRWVQAIVPELGLGGFGLSCLPEHRHDITYDGSAEALRDHVTAILAGRETTITARAPVAWSGKGGGRLWRIKAGPSVTNFVVSDESPHFVGWGTGEPEEVPKLLRILRTGALKDRVRAAADLADLGPAARQALPTLRRTLRDPVPAVGLAAARALVMLDTDVDEAIETIKGYLRNPSEEVRSDALAALDDPRLPFQTVLPMLLRALADKDGQVRADAAETVGRVGPAAPQDSVAALVALLENEKEGRVRLSVVQSLRCFGPHAWAALPALREALWGPDDRPFHTSSKPDVIDLLARFHPSPVELLAEVFADPRLDAEVRHAAARQLIALGPRARAALPELRRVLREQQEGVDVVRALLAVDPKNGPALVAPVVVEMARSTTNFRESSEAAYLLVQCGPAARPALPALLGALKPEHRFANLTARNLTPVLGPEDRAALPLLRQVFAAHDDDLGLAMALLRLGRQQEAVEHAARGLKDKDRPSRVAAARWLGERGREARAVEPLIRQALEAASGVERTRLALTLWRARGEEGTVAQVRAFTALSDFLNLCEGETPVVGPIPEAVFWWWTSGDLCGQQDLLGAAVVEIHSRVQASDDPAAVLIQALRDKSPHVRLAAAAALARVDPGHPDTAPTLQRLLTRHPYFFRYAADTLAALGPNAAPVAPLVWPLLSHPNQNVHRAVDLVLRRIDPTFAVKASSAAAPGAVPMDLGPLWQDLAGKDAFRADLAVWRLAGASSSAVALVRERLRPPKTLAPERVARLVADLDSDDYDSRERASTDLTDAVECAAPALRRALAADPPLEMRRRLEELLAGLDPTSTPEQRRRLRAVRLLEEMGGRDAQELLERLSRGDARFTLTREAVSALHHLDHPEKDHVRRR
jgi:HEAT repeat protein